MGCKCGSYITQGRAGEKGSWCVECGTKVFDVDDRVCGDCIHFIPSTDALGLSGVSGVCGQHLMRVTACMHVTYQISEGSCWKDKQDVPRGLMGDQP